MLGYQGLQNALAHPHRKQGKEKRTASDVGFTPTLSPILFPSWNTTKDGNWERGTAFC
jgi:hypothetical protein